LASASVNNVFRHFVKHWGQAVIQQEAQYDYITEQLMKIGGVGKRCFK
jgi:hypothetical protein